MDQQQQHPRKCTCLRRGPPCYFSGALAPSPMCKTCVVVGGILIAKKLLIANWWESSDQQVSQGKRGLRPEVEGVGCLRREI